MGNYKKGSDVDIAIICENIANKTLFKLDDYLNEVYPLPYFFDIINYQVISNEKLKEHIDSEGKIIYILRKFKFKTQGNCINITLCYFFLK